MRNDSTFFNYLEKRELTNRDLVFQKFNTRLYRVTYKWDGETYKEIQVKLGQDAEILGILTVRIDETIDEDDYIAIIQGAYALSLKLHQNYLVQSLARKCSSELIEDLLKGRLSKRKELVKRGELAGWDLTVPYQLFIMRVKPEEDNGEDFYYFELKEKIIRNLHWIIKTNISRKYIIFAYEENILLLINYPEQLDEIREDIKKIRQKINQRIPIVNVNIGAGSFINTCLEIAESYQEGLYILEFLEATNQTESIFFYEDLGILRLLWQVDQDKLKKFTTEFLNKLIEYDSGNNTDLLETVGAFLEEGGSIQKAAEKLYIHPNTMSYRIKRIQEILGLNLQDFETQLNLATAYKIYKYIFQAGKKGMISNEIFSY
ncbi:MAG: CdaR family transcriptional regulator [Firmicutes bacterium]|nr:CdaR family transcriptional regulator [Bacillota bacterium]